MIQAIRAQPSAQERRQATGDSLPFARNFGRGLRWVKARRGRFADARGEGQYLYFSRKALAALGRLSPEARAAATRGLAEQDRFTYEFVQRQGRWVLLGSRRKGGEWLPPGADDKESNMSRLLPAGEGKDGEKHQLCVFAPVRVADLNWREVRRYTDALRAAEPPDGKLQVQIAYAGGPRRAREYGANSGVLEHYEFLAPALPNLEFGVAQALARGMSQEQINRAVRPDSRRTVIAPPAEHGIETPLLAGDFFGHQSRHTIRRFGPLWEGGNIIGFRSTGVAMRFPSPTQFGYYWEHGVDAAACAAEYQHKVKVQAGREAQAKQSARDARAVRLMRRLCKKAVITRFAVRASGACQAGIESWLQANGWPASQDKLTIGQLPPVRDWPGYLADGVSVELAALLAARR